MTFLDRYAAEWAARAGCRVFLPGEPLPECPPPTIQEAADRLLRAGCTVLPPGEAVPVSVERAKEVLYAADYSVFAPEVPPAIGAWVPEHADAYPTRFVSGVVGDTVTYGCMGVTHTCKVKTFHIWRRLRHAKLHDMQAKVQEPTQ